MLEELASYGEVLNPNLAHSQGMLTLILKEEGLSTADLLSLLVVLMLKNNFSSRDVTDSSPVNPVGTGGQTSK